MTKNEQIEDASKTKVNTAFLIEALVLMAVLIASMAVFTQLFTHSAVAAHQAKELTRATLLAQNAAEASGAHDLRSFIDGAGTQVTFTVIAQDGKELAATATIAANGCTVDAWKMTTTQELPEQALLSTN